MLREEMLVNNAASSNSAEQMLASESGFLLGQPLSSSLGQTIFYGHSGQSPQHCMLPTISTFYRDPSHYISYQGKLIFILKTIFFSLNDLLKTSPFPF